MGIHCRPEPTPISKRTVMHIEDLHAFVTVAEQGSFSRAAERLYRTQSAISKRVAALEEELQARLFDRIGHRIDLTEAGRALLPRARRILAEVEDSARAVRNLTGEIAGRLSVATSHHIGLHRLPPVLRAFTRDYPAVHLDLRFMDSEGVCEAVGRGELEVGIVTLPLAPPENLDTRRVWKDHLNVVVGRDHPLAARAPRSAAALAGYAAVLPGPGTYTRALMEEAFAALGAPLRVTLSTNYLETLKMLAAVGLGWTLLPDTMVDDTLVLLKVPKLNLHRDLGIVTHRRRMLSNAGKALIGQVTGNKKIKGTGK